MDCGEQALLPAVRQAGPETLIVADGFSCKTQIADSGIGRPALHTAQVIKMARDGHDPAASAMPRPPAARRVIRVTAVVAPAVAVLGAAVAAAMGRRTSRALR
jgi:hypothetical protein